MKSICGGQLKTVFARQGHYALDPQIVAVNPSADITIQRIGDLVHYDLPSLLEPREIATKGRINEIDTTTS
jgi:hypothetical protein